MKTFVKTLGLTTALVSALIAGPIRAQDDTAAPPPAEGAVAAPAPGDGGVSFQTFYDQLANQGNWVQTDQYGYAFQPTESNPDWRPYTYGHWVNTDAGMTWVSDDSFGWATDHYGRWVNLDGYGWVWVPGYTWAPAWVSWREGGDDVGWAPLPPDSDVGIDYYGGNSFDFGVGSFGFHIGDDCDTAYGIGPGCYNFCPVLYIGDNDCWRHFRDRRDNFTSIRNTRNVTNINFNRDGAGRFGRVRAEGPSVAALNARAHTPIRNVSLAAASRRDEAGLHGRTLAVYAPRVDRSTIATARPASVSAHLAHVAVNRGTDINRPLAVNSRVAPAAPTSAQVHAATLAQGSYSANARIATTGTRLAHPLSEPLTSLRTEARSGATNTSNNSRLTGEPVQRREANPAVAERSFTGESATAVHHESFVQHAPAYAASGASVYHREATASVYHPNAPAYHPQASSSVFHHSAPAYHPQASFHPTAHATQPHFGGGGSHGGGAPALHSGGGGHPSGGGAHASAGNNRH